jgi:hypothetical protein
MKKKNVIPKNYLDKKPMPAPSLRWNAGEDGMIILERDNVGFANRLAQILLRKPKVSYIHLDAMGSFLWPLMDGEKDITALGKLVDEHFGEEAHPLYERLARYVQILDSYGFLAWNE